MLSDVTEVVSDEQRFLMIAISGLWYHWLLFDHQGIAHDSEKGNRHSEGNPKSIKTRRESVLT